MQTCASSGMRWCSAWIGRRFSIPTSGRWRCNARTTARCVRCFFWPMTRRNPCAESRPLPPAWTGRVSFLCATTGDYCDFLSLPEYKPAFVAGSTGRVEEARHRRYYAYQPPADSDTVAAIRQASAQNGYLLFRAHGVRLRSGFVDANLSAGRARHKPVLPRKKMLRRFLNAMGREAPVRLDHARSWDAVAPILPQFMQVSRGAVSGHRTYQQHGTPGAARVSGGVGKVAFRRLAG